MHLLLAAALVTVRIYNYAGVPAQDLAAAEQTANQIFAAAGIPVTWIDCSTPLRPTGRTCTEPLAQSGEFVLRLASSSGRVEKGHVALGSSLIDKDAATGVLITLEPHLIWTAATQADADPAEVFGRAIAHEVGHLLLGMPRHAGSGLMRAIWSQEELRQNRRADWLFSADEIAVMHRTLARALRAER